MATKTERSFSIYMPNTDNGEVHIKFELGANTPMFASAPVNGDHDALYDVAATLVLAQLRDAMKWAGLEVSRNEPRIGIDPDSIVSDTLHHVFELGAYEDELDKELDK